MACGRKKPNLQLFWSAAVTSQSSGTSSYSSSWIENIIFKHRAQTIDMWHKASCLWLIRISKDIINWHNRYQWQVDHFSGWLPENVLILQTIPITIVSHPPSNQASFYIVFFIWRPNFSFLRGFWPFSISESWPSPPPRLLPIQSSCVCVEVRPDWLALPSSSFSNIWNEMITGVPSGSDRADAHDAFQYTQRREKNKTLAIKTSSFRRSYSFLARLVICKRSQSMEETQAHFYRLGTKPEKNLRMLHAASCFWVVVTLDATVKKLDRFKHSCLEVTSAFIGQHFKLIRVSSYAYTIWWPC